MRIFAYLVRSPAATVRLGSFDGAEFKESIRSSSGAGSFTAAAENSFDGGRSSIVDVAVAVVVAAASQLGARGVSGVGRYCP